MNNIIQTSSKKKRNQTRSNNKTEQEEEPKYKTRNKANLISDKQKVILLIIN